MHVLLTYYRKTDKAVEFKIFTCNLAGVVPPPRYKVTLRYRVTPPPVCETFIFSFVENMYVLRAHSLMDKC